MTVVSRILAGILSVIFESTPLQAQVTVIAHLTAAPHPGKQGETPHFPPAVLWLVPANTSTARGLLWPSHGPYILLQKNRTFMPHLLVIPVGAVVSFPNADPFFHNVFSLFDGKRFDLGLYESGSSKQVHFDRPGVSYIFCNIHPEMSAVVLALTTPFWSVADNKGEFDLKGVSPGEYEVHVWAEGADPLRLEQWTHGIQISSANRDVGNVPIEIPPSPPPHKNMFDQPYATETAPY